MFTKSLTQYHRRTSTEVIIGTVKLGAQNAVRLQSMTNTDTLNFDATLAQIKRMADAGSELVRITTPTVREAELLADYKRALADAGYTVPLIADVHFNAAVAEAAARSCDKVRINPGNYVDKKRFKAIEYTEAEYQTEVEKIRERFVPLIKICKENKTAMRVGTNHGSLSDRIMSRFGDTPDGMVESVLEFLRICVSENYTDVVISMKASNPIVMIQAVRLLVMEMAEEHMHFPLHLGVTEAGNDTDGRIKSAVGIGTLLLDGIGDTIRVSLTEAPEKELPVAKAIADYFKTPEFLNYQPKFNTNPDTARFFKFRKRKTKAVLNIGGDHVPVVILSDNPPFSKGNTDNPTFSNGGTDDTLFSKGGTDNPPFSKGGKGDYCALDENTLIDSKNKTISHKILKFKDLENITNPKFIELSEADISLENLSKLKTDSDTVLILNTNGSASPVHLARSVFFFLEELNLENPVILKHNYTDLSEANIVRAALEFGALFNDGFADGIWLTSEHAKTAEIEAVAFTILQAVRARITKTDYISCPSCGRTLFDLESTVAKVKASTSHLTGVKIAVMGCIVNGPGEMADADYGYVGAGKAKINLYKGQTIVKKNIPEAEAVEELLKFIEEDRTN